MSWEFELVAGPYGGTTEGPAWDGETLLFTNIPNNRIMRYDPRSGECSEFRTGINGTNGLVFDAGGRLYGCCAGARSIVRFEADGRSTVIVDRLDGRRMNTPNDLAVDRLGRVWFTNPWNDGLIDPSERMELDHKEVLRADPQTDGGWTLRRMTHDSTSPNGILFSQDERILYVAQSDYEGVRELRAYPLLEDDTLGAYTVLHQFGQNFRGVHRGVDGMCLDTEGNIIATAGWREAGPGPMVYVFAPSGRVVEPHPVPVDRPTNCTFGDADLSTFYLTTWGGHLFRVRNTGRRGWLLYPP